MTGQDDLGWVRVHAVRRMLAVSSTLTVVATLAVTAASGVEEVEQELDRAARSLEDIEAALHAAEAEIVAAERRLREATIALEAVEDELAEAERAVAAAEADRRARARDLELADEALAEAEQDHVRAVARLTDRSVEVFKYGTGRPQQALVAGVIGAHDWHEVAVTASTVSRIVASDRALVEAAVRSREIADRARVHATDAELAAIVAEQRAIDEGAQLRALVEEHEGAVAAVEEEHRQREAVVAELEADGELVALLVARLEAELTQALRAAAEPEPEPEPAPEPEPEPEPEPDPDAEPDPEPDGGPGEERAPEPEPAAPEQPAWASRLPAAGQPWAADIAAAAARHGVDGRLFAALVWTESAFRPDAVSWAGAIGLAQLMPTTAAWLGVDPWDPLENLDGGARYLAMQHRTFGSLELALAAYNAGPTAVRAAGPGIPDYVETQLYVVRVLERYNLLTAP